MSAFEHVLTDCLADYQAPTQRYSSKDFVALHQITQTGIVNYI